MPVTFDFANRETVFIPNFSKSDTRSGLAFLCKAFLYESSSICLTILHTYCASVVMTEECEPEWH